MPLWVRKEITSYEGTSLELKKKERGCIFLLEDKRRAINKKGGQAHKTDKNGHNLLSKHKKPACVLVVVQY